jgi:hypothetical protein
MLELDHLVIAATDLDAGEAWLSERLGVPLTTGGQHPGWGTHNRLLQLGGGTYLELIAIDPAQPEPAAPRPFRLDERPLRERLAQSPQLVHWIVRTDDLDGTLAGLNYDPGPVASMTRGALRWRITVPADGRPAAGGLLPTVIRWDVDAHPSSRLPDTGVRLEGLEVRAPAAILAQRPAVTAAVPLRWVESGEPGLSATLRTPLGTVVIASHCA